MSISKGRQDVRIEISSQCIRNQGGSSENEFYQITVEDNGIGFDQEHAKQIFGVFRRLHGRDEYEGSGMGLAICRKIVELHGGIITATSIPGQGTTLIVAFPVQQPIGGKMTCMSMES